LLGYQLSNLSGASSISNLRDLLSPGKSVPLSLEFFIFFLRLIESVCFWYPHSTCALYFLSPSSKPSLLAVVRPASISPPEMAYRFLYVSSKSSFSALRIRAL
jgi:hypothetical protein